jgi:hypothetical protein
MRSILNRRNLVLLLSLVAIGVLVVLVSGVRDLKFQPGIPIVLDESERQGLETSLDSTTRITLGKQVVFWISVAGVVVLISFLVVPELRKRLLRILLNIGLTLFILSYLYENRLLSLPGFLDGEASNAGPSNPGADGALTPQVFVPPEESSVLSFIISFGLIFMFLLSAWLLFRWWRRMRAPVPVFDSLTDFAAIARRSLKEISSGREWQGVIQECYLRMSDAVNNKRGIYRSESMTTGEFAVKLEQSGLPSQSVNRLTRLFEAVRYGAHKAVKSDVDEAVACLTDILHACGESV